MATNSCTDVRNTALAEVFSTYFKYARDNNRVPSLKGLHEFDNTIILNGDATSDVKKVWNQRFQAAAKDFSVTKVATDQPDWLTILQQLMDKMLANTRGSESSKKRSTTSTASSKNSVLSDEQWQSFESKFKTMKESEMWRIGDVYVEKEVYKYAKTQKSEHAAHSFIVDLKDECWKNVFDVNVLNEIATKNNPKLEALPPDLEEYFERFRNKGTVDELWRTAKSSEVLDAVEQFDLDWSQRTILDLISSYRWGVVSRVASTGLEKDMLVRFWRNMDLCFDNLFVETQRGDQQSIATSARTNEERVSDDGSILPRVRVEKPDLILAKDAFEYGCSEAGGDDSAGVGVKEVFERRIKLPKIMKDMLLKLQAKLDHDAEVTHKVKIVGFSHTHLRTTALTMDNPCGYICRVLPLAEQVIPVQPSLFYTNVIPFLEVTWKMKKVVESTLKIVETGPTKRRSSDYAGGQGAVLIPSCLDVRAKPTASRKRMRTDFGAPNEQ